MRRHWGPPQDRCLTKMALKNITKLFTSTPSMASTESSDFIKGQRAQEMDDFTYGFPPHEASRPQRDSVQRWKSTSLVLLKCVGVFLLGAFSAVGYASLKKDGGSWSVCPNDRKPFVYCQLRHPHYYRQGGAAWTHIRSSSCQSSRSLRPGDLV